MIDLVLVCLQEKLAAIYREFAIDDTIDPSIDNDAINFWILISKMKSLMGNLLYKNLATLALSNADSERVFSLSDLLASII